jgi:hypothetical protein
LKSLFSMEPCLPAAAAAANTMAYKSVPTLP